jgi:hypothetical protein
VRQVRTVQTRPQSRLLLIAVAIGAVIGALAAGVLVASAGAPRTTPPRAPRTVAAARVSTAAPAPVRLAVPNVVGVRLDRAKAALDRGGFRHHVKGGGLFGVLDDTNWVVCSTEPAPSSRVEPGRSVVLRVERSC